MLRWHKKLLPVLSSSLLAFNLSCSDSSSNTNENKNQRTPISIDSQSDQLRIASVRPVSMQHLMVSFSKKLINPSRIQTYIQLKDLMIAS